MKRPAPLGSHDDAELNQLLARGRLSGAEYDAIEKRVLDRVAPKPRRPRWPMVAPAVALAAGCVLWFAVRPGVPGPSHVGSLGTTSAFAEKGGGTPALGVVSVGCGNADGHCRLGDALLFSVTGNRTPVYLSAYAERTDTPGGPRIWYFPHAGAVTPEVAASPNTKVLPEGIHLGPPHAPGHYRIRVRLSASPLGRVEADKLGPNGEQSFPLEIVD